MNRTRATTCVLIVLFALASAWLGCRSQNRPVTSLRKTERGKEKKPKADFEASLRRTRLKGGFVLVMPHARLYKAPSISSPSLPLFPDDPDRVKKAKDRDHFNQPTLSNAGVLLTDLKVTRLLEPDKEMIRRYFTQYLSDELINCFHTALKENPRLRGYLKIEFDIDRDGYIASRSITFATMHYPLMERCVLDVLGRIRLSSKGRHEGKIAATLQFERLPKVSKVVCPKARWPKLFRLVQDQGQWLEVEPITPSEQRRHCATSPEPLYGLGLRIFVRRQDLALSTVRMVKARYAAGLKIELAVGMPLLGVPGDPGRYCVPLDLMDELRQADHQSSGGPAHSYLDYRSDPSSWVAVRLEDEVVGLGYRSPMHMGFSKPSHELNNMNVSLHGFLFTKRDRDGMSSLSVHGIRLKGATRPVGKAPFPKVKVLVTVGDACTRAELWADRSSLQKAVKRLSGLQEPNNNPIPPYAIKGAKVYWADGILAGRTTLEVNLTGPASISKSGRRRQCYQMVNGQASDMHLCFDVDTIMAPNRKTISSRTRRVEVGCPSAKSGYFLSDCEDEEQEAIVGEVLILNDSARYEDVPLVPYIYRGEAKIGWDIRSREIEVNGQVIGVDLTGLSVEESLSLIKRHKNNIKVVIWENSSKLHPMVIRELAGAAEKELLLNLEGYSGSAASLKALKRLSGKVSCCILKNGSLTDSGLGHVTLLSRLRHLDLSATNVTDFGMKQVVARLSNLVHLNLEETHVTDAGMKHVSILGNLRHLNLSRTNVTDHGMRYIARLTGLSYLDLGVNYITETGIKSVAHLTNLKHLGLYVTKVTDAGMSHVAQLTNLQHLDLSHTKVTDAGITYISRLFKLRHLRLIRTNVTDAGMAHIASLSDLKQLNLAETNVTDTGIAHIARLSNLQQLYLDFTKVTDAGMSHIARLVNLRHLTLEWTNVTDAGTAHFMRLVSLRNLYLDRTKITDTGMAHIARLTNLRQLSLDSTKITDIGISHVARLTNLLQLSLAETDVTDAGMSYVARLANLQHLRLWSTKITDKAISNIVRLTNLRYLDLDSTRLTDAGMTHVARLADLRQLNLGSTKITDTGMANVARLAKLRKLDLKSTKVTDTGMAHIVRLANLRQLNLEKTRITDIGISHIARLANLQELVLRNTKVTYIGKAHIARLANLRRLILDNTKITDFGISHISLLVSLQYLHLGSTEITDAGMAHVFRLSNLRSLYLSSTNITDDGMANVEQLTTLSQLVLLRTKITDAGIIHIARLSYLQNLDLDHTKITDKGIANIARLSNLKRLELRDTKVTKAAIKWLLKKIPHCFVMH